MNPGDPQIELDEGTRRDLVRLADGTLRGAARASLERRIAASPALRLAFERQRSTAAALAALEVGAPQRLKARIEGERADGTRRRGRRPRLAIGGALAGAAAAAALAAVLMLPSGGTGPTVVEAARLSELPATGTVRADSSNPTLLAAAVEGVSFPRWSKEFGYRQSGVRADRLDGRSAKTVFYERGGRRLAYTIVSGPGIRAPADSEPANLNGVSLHTLRDGDRRVVTWWRRGRTCVLSATGVGDRQLLRLASWKGDGEVPF